METKTKLLIAIGSAVIANCQPCLKTLLKQAKENQIEDNEITEAINIAKVVRKNSTNQIDQFITNITGTESTLNNIGEGCGCT